MIGAALLAGCGSDRDGNTDAVASVSSAGNTSGLRGTELSQPVSLTSSAAQASFSSTAGGNSTLGNLQDGHLMLVYYGYTHCPDVCPTTMADLGIAVRRLPQAEQRRVQVVFVTSDPDRDSVPVMSAWLHHFDGGLATPFVGLTAGLDQVDSVASSMGVPLSAPEVAADGSVTVEHGAQTLAFAAGKASLVWLASTSPSDLAHDIRILLGAS